jgi:adenylate cyclase
VSKTPDIFTSNSKADVVAGLRALLCSRGVSEEDFEEALRTDSLDALAVDRLLLPGSGSKTGKEISESSGIPYEHAGRLWRALGFPETGDEAFFNEQDLEALSVIKGLADGGFSSVDNSVQVTRVLGQSMARLADALVSSADAAANSEQKPAWATPEEGDEGLLLAQVVALFSELVLPNMEQLILYAWRRHIQAAARRHIAMRRAGTFEEAMLPRLVVGFADMVGFTALSSQLSAEALVEVVDRFEDLAHTTVVDGGGRPVKMIGDEVMFVCGDPETALHIGLDLVEAYADDDLLSDVRVGLACGPVLLREGDFFGSTVNRAHRVVSIADAGTVLCSDEVHREVAREGDPFTWRRLRPRVLKDLGRVVLWNVRRTGRDTSQERRSGARWRRLSDLNEELATLRKAGEQALSSLREL